MADTITVTNDKPQFAVCPAGTTKAVCVDVIDLGEKLESFQNNPPQAVRKIALVFQTALTNPETGKPFELSQEFTLSFGKKANLRKFLAGWRGQSYTDEEAAKGVPLHKLEKRCCNLTVEHKQSASGNTYARIMQAGPLMEEQSKLEPQGYTRAEFWTTRKQEYAEAVAKWRREQEPRAPEAVLAGVEDDDDLPF